MGNAGHVYLVTTNQDASSCAILNLVEVFCVDHGFICFPVLIGVLKQSNLVVVACVLGNLAPKQFFVIVDTVLHRQRRDIPFEPLLVVLPVIGDSPILAKGLTDPYSAFVVDSKSNWIGQ